MTRRTETAETTEAGTARPRGAFVGVLVAFAFLLGLAGGAGGMALRARHNLERLRDHARADASGATGAAVVPPAERAAVALAYENPEVVSGRMHRITWAVENVAAPFVNSLPRPGQHRDCTITPEHLRSEAPLVLPRPAGTMRIFLTGGSTAFSSGAPSEATTIGELLEAELNRGGGVDGRHVEVFTAANPGWASTHERIWIVNRLAGWEPDLVISLSGTNDVHWAVSGRNVLWFWNYYEKNRNRFLERLHRMLGEPSPVAETPRVAVSPETVAERLARNIRLAAAGLEGTGARYLFVLQPTWAVTKKALSPREVALGATPPPGYDAGFDDFFRAAYATIVPRLDALDAPGLRIASATGIFDSLPVETEIFLDRYHFGDRGNRLIAAFLAGEVRALYGEPARSSPPAGAD